LLLGGTPIGVKYAVGGHWLVWLTTNRVTREVFSRLLGLDAVLVDAREERRPNRTRFTFTDADRLILDLDVHLGTRARVNTLGPGELEGYRGYGVRDGRLLGWAVTCHDVGSAFHSGPHRGTLKLGDHPVSNLLRSLDLSNRTFGAGIRVSGREVYDGPVPLGPATQQPPRTSAGTTRPPAARSSARHPAKRP
jgi:hypothetical protein